ncbi:hypothetical protein VTK26DRAFT_8391 [Humicola hyalothermophila]
MDPSLSSLFPWRPWVHVHSNHHRTFRRAIICTLLRSHHSHSFRRDLLGIPLEPNRPRFSVANVIPVVRHDQQEEPGKALAERCPNWLDNSLLTTILSQHNNRAQPADDLTIPNTNRKANK